MIGQRDWWVLIWLTTLSGATGLAQDGIPAARLPYLKDATVLVRASGTYERRTGAGFLVGRKGETGYVVTSAHILEPMIDLSGLAQMDVHGAVMVTFRSGTANQQRLGAYLVGFDPAHDLALVRVRSQQLPPPLDVYRQVVPRETQSVYLFGFPPGTAHDTTLSYPTVVVSQATITSLDKDVFGNLAAIRLDGGITPSNSGGPALNRSGYLVGVTSANRAGTENGFLIPADYLRESLRGRITTIKLGTVGAAEGIARLTAMALTIDPLDRIVDAALLTCPAKDVRGRLKPRRGGHWSIAASGMTTWPLRKFRWGFVGDVYLKAKQLAATTFVVQPVFRRAGGERVYLEPARVELPARGDLAPTYSAVAKSVAGAGNASWFFSPTSPLTTPSAARGKGTALPGQLGRIPRAETIGPSVAGFDANAPPPLDETTRLSFLAARGWVAADFALCQTMPIGEFMHVVQQLASKGYRPLTLRPYVDGNIVRVAAAWIRDGLPWRMVTGATAAEIEQADERIRDQGFHPVDVAGCMTDREYYVGLWAKLPGNQPPTTLMIGVPQSQFKSKLQELKKKGRFFPVRRQRFLARDGQLRESSVWIDPTPKPGFWYFGGTADFYENQCRARPNHVPVDICISPGSDGKLLYFGAMVALSPPPVFAESHGLDAETHLSRCQQFAKEGYRPTAIAVAADRAKGRLVTASIWHKQLLSFSGQ